MTCVRHPNKQANLSFFWSRAIIVQYYDHESRSADAGANQYTHVRPTQTCCHQPCPLISGLGRWQCLPQQSNRRRRTASFSSEVVHALLQSTSISSQVLAELFSILDCNASAKRPPDVKHQYFNGHCIAAELSAISYKIIRGKSRRGAT